MTLEEIFPKVAEFTLEATGPHVHALRRFGLSDHSWLKEKFSLTIVEIVQVGKTDPYGMWDKIAQIVYRLLMDKSPFKIQEFNSFDDDGKEVKEKIGGAKLFFRSISANETVKVMQAFNKTMEDSSPVPEKDPVKIEEEKKSEVEDPQKN